MGTYSNYYESSKLLHGSMMNIMGTRLDVLFLGAAQAEALQIWSDMEEEVNRLDKMLNIYDKESELATINREAVLSPVCVKDELWRILMDCQKYHQLTFGYFDISLKNFQKISFNQENQTVFFQGETLQLDLGGYAKGYALEKLRTILLAGKITQALINFGNSSVLALGAHPYGENWEIGINDPYNPQKTIGTVELYDNTMSTSGNMPQHDRHIINPHTGIYSEERKVVSVIAKNAIDAEVLSTALMVAGEEMKQEILSHFKIDKHVIFDL
ncbi:MAG: FAD:protein FMN transferase [Bacteroidales bacterium]|nr:FAD:protein FMN transferase [Bacteroidales bacterium]